MLQTAAERRETVLLQCFHVFSEGIQIRKQKLIPVRLYTEIRQARGTGTEIFRIGTGKEIQAAADNGKAKTGTVAFAGGKNAADLASIADDVIRPFDASRHSAGADGIRHGQSGTEGKKSGIREGKSGPKQHAAIPAYARRGKPGTIHPPAA